MRWSDQIDGVPIQAGYSLFTHAQRLHFASDGFGDEFHHPVVFFDYPKGLEPKLPGYLIAGKPADRYFSGARVGSGFVRQRAAVNVMLSMNWAEIERLLAENDGDMFVSLYDAAGITLKSIRIPRSYFSDVEQSLRLLYAKSVAREADREQQCAVQTDIYITTDQIYVD